MASFKRLLGNAMKNKSQESREDGGRSGSASSNDGRRKLGDDNQDATKLRLLGMMAKAKMAASIAASAGGAHSQRPKLVIWPEWNDADVNAEKWDVAHKGKEKDKGKSPVASHLFEDPEGRIDMPPSMKVAHWKRPCDFITEKTPAVVDQDCLGDFDLITANEHLHESELMRYIISQIMALWEMSAVKNPPPDQMDPSVPYEEISHSWRPWEHIYAVNKVVKGPHVPPYNSYGKYALRLYWMGSWRKVIIDDMLPCDDQDRLLLPATTNQHELWPLLLTKGLIKIASLDYTGGSPSSEFGDVSIIQCLTGWIPESIPLQGFLSSSPPAPPTPPAGGGRASPLVSASQVLDKYFQLSSQPNPQDPSTRRIKSSKSTADDTRYGHINEVWELLKASLPEWKLPLQEWEKAALEQQEADKKEEATPSEAAKDDKSEKESAVKDGKAEKADSKSGKEGDKGKAKDTKDKDKGGKDKDKKDKDKDKDKKDKEKSTMEDMPIPDKPEVVVFATYHSPPKYPAKVSLLGEMADASEKLRQNGLSHLYPHPVCITQTRSCPLEPPPPPEIIPAWKLIRPRKKKKPPSDEPIAEPEQPKPIQCLEITSPFVNYKVSPVPIPTETHRPRSSLERGGTRSRPNTGHVTSIEETDENAPEVDPATVKTEEEPPKAEEPVEPPPPTPEPEPEIKPSSPAGKEKRKASATKRSEGKDNKTASSEASPKQPRKSVSAEKEKSKPERGKSAERSASRGSKKDHKEEEKLKAPSQGEQHGLAPPPVPVDGGSSGEEDGQEGDQQLPQESGEEDSSAKPKKVWMDFDQFCKCFKTLYIYHKPNTYICNQKHPDLKNVSPSTAPAGKGDKKSAPIATGVNTSSSKTAQNPNQLQSVPSPTNPLSTTGAEDRTQHYLFVDNLKPTEIVVCFSSLSRWHDPPPPMEDKKSHTSVKGGKGGDKDADKELTNVTSASVMEVDMSYRMVIPEPTFRTRKTPLDFDKYQGSVSGVEPKAPPVVHPGSLIAEPYSWKSLVTGQPILRLRTTATRAAVLTLPAGRHVLRFMMTGPLGYHVHLCSTVQFVFGDEETVMAQLTKESCRFVDNATQVMNSIGKCINNFSDKEAFKQSWEELVNYHCPYRNDKLMSKVNHFKIFNEALYNTLRKCLADIANPDLAFAWRAFTFDATTKNILGLPTSSRPATGTTSHRGSAKPSKEKDKDKDKKRVAQEVKTQQQEASVDGEADKVENPWANREPTIEEQMAAVRIQKMGKGYVVRKLANARTPGTDENDRVLEPLGKSWSILEQNIEANGLFLFRYMFKLDPDIMQKYPFYQDEWNKISYADYSGQYPDQPPNTWFVVFREIFYVTEEMLAVPKLYVPISTCMLRVVNNDTGQEIPKVFQKVAPYIYKKNKKGYTFVAEARTTEMPLATGRWRMRMIGSLSPLPAPQRNEKNEVTCNSTFHVRDIKDYYVPNPKDIIFRYSVKVTEDHLASIQVNTSKLDVYIKLVVLDNEVEVATTVGKGHTVIPSFIFLKDIEPGSEDKRPSSRSSNKDGKEGKDSKGKGSSHAAKLKRSGSAKSVDGRTSRGSRHSDAGVSDGEIDEKDLKPHKYIIQATVLRNSWPLSESSWAFVQMLKEMERNELKVANKDRPPSPPKQEKTPAASSSVAKGGKAKGGKDKGGKDKGDQKGSRPPSQQFDIGKPHWVLRVVSDGNTFEDIEVKKDTERVDEIRAMKKAWENAEPGRAAKALQSRLKYLGTHMIKLQPDKEEEDAKEGEEKESQPESELPPPQTPLSLHGDGADEILMLEPPPPPTPKEILPPLDITPFLRKASGEPRYLDEEEIQRREDEKKKEVEEYKLFRDQVKQWREQDKLSRNQIKIKQLEQCEELQEALDDLREAFHVSREAFRQKCIALEQERSKLESENSSAMLDNAREAINKPREAFRQTYLEAERKRQEELAEKEAAMAAEIQSKSPKGRKGGSAKKGGSGKKKK